MITVTVEREDGAEEEIQLATMREVCWRCDGRGVTDCFEGGFTASDEWADEDFREEYVRGTYDRRCSECNGANVVEVVDRDRCTAEELAAFDAYEDGRREYEAEVAAERRYFGG